MRSTISSAELGRLRDKMFRYARSIMGEASRAEDVVQDVLVKMLEEKPLKNAEAFAMKATRNKCLDALRHKAFLQKNKADLPDEETGSGKFPGAAVEGGEAVERREAGKIVEEAMGRLPEEQREAIHLKDIEGYEMGIVAEMMGLREATLRVVLSRGRKVLREEVTKLMK